MASDEYSLVLNNITSAESYINRSNPDGWNQYWHYAFTFLNTKGKFLFEHDIVNQYREGMTIKRVIEQEPHRFVQGTNRKKDGKMVPTWYDLWAMEEITKNDELFEYFFACKLRHISPLKIDEFLDFHLAHNFGNDLKKYLRFLTIVLREQKGNLLSENIVETAKEWIKIKEGGGPMQGVEKELKQKGKIKRQRDDKLTRLNQEQTAMLIYCLRETKIILKDEYLNNSEAGYAFHLLTGYSTETLRQNLNLSEKASIANKKNTAVLLKALNDLQKFIQDKLEPEL